MCRQQHVITLSGMFTQTLAHLYPTLKKENSLLKEKYPPYKTGFCLTHTEYLDG